MHSYNIAHNLRLLEAVDKLQCFVKDLGFKHTKHIQEVANHTLNEMQDSKYIFYSLAMSNNKPEKDTKDPQ